MDRRSTFMYALAFVFCPLVIAAKSWESGIAQMVGVFIVMMVVDALILGIAHLLQGQGE